MKIQISNGMFIALIINMVYPKAVGVTQGIMAREVDGDFWISTIFATIQGIFAMFLVVWLIKRTPDKNIFDQSELLLGKWGGKLISLIFFIFFLGTFGVVMITFVYHMMDYFMPEAPILFFIIVAVLIGIIGNLYGLEVIARYSYMGVLSIMVFQIILLMGSLAFFDIRELMPVMQSGFVNTLWASRHNDTDWAMATGMAAVLLPSVKASRLWGKSGMYGILMGGLFVVMWPILEGGVLSPEVAAQYTVSCMQMARSAQIGNFIHRYEMFMVAFFAVVSLVQIMLSFLCASEAASHLVGKPHNKVTTIPTALFLGAFGYAIVFDKSVAMKMLEEYWPSISVSIVIVVPVILLLLGTVMKKRLHG